MSRGVTLGMKRLSGLILTIAVVTALLGSLPRQTLAQSAATVRGFVSESARAIPLQGASIGLFPEADGRPLGTATDADGYFVISRVRPGRYTLRVSFIGYVTYEERVDVTAGAVMVRRVALDEDETLVGEVIVEAEREGGAATVAAGLQTIVPAQIETVPVPGVSGDLSAYLQSLPGVIAQGDRGGQLFLRGGAADQGLATIDGLPVYLPFHILSFFSAFPEEIVDEVDLYSAGFGARYGSRVSSVVDVRTRNGSKQRLSGSLALAPFLSGVRVEGPLVRDHVSFIGTYRRSLVSELMPNLLGQKFPYNFGDAFGKLHAVFGSGSALSFTGVHTFDRGDVAGTRKTFGGDIVNEAATDSNEVAWDNTVVAANYRYNARTLPLTVELNGGLSEMSNSVGPSGEPNRESKISSYDGALTLQYHLSGVAVRAGVRYRQSDLSYALGGQFQELESASSELQETIAFVELPIETGAFSLEPSVQVYSVPDFETVVDPRFRASWSHTGQVPISVHAAWGQYHQAIAGLTDERDVGSVFMAWVPARERLQSSEHIVGGLRVVPTRWLAVSLEGFQKKFTDLSVPVFSVFPGFTTALQSADGSARGFDARISLYDYPIHEGWTVGGHATYAYSRVLYETALTEYHPPHDRRQQVNVVLRAEHRDYAISLQSQYGTGLPFNESAGFDKFIVLTPDIDVEEHPGLDRIAYGEPFGGRLPVYARTDIWVEKRVDQPRHRLTVRAGAVNVFNRSNLFYFDLFTFRRVDQLPIVPSVGLKVEFH